MVRRSQGLRKVARFLALGVLPLAAAGACATQAAFDPEEPPPQGPDASAEATSPVDAGPSEDVQSDAGPCSTSGLCKVPAPIDTRINITSIHGSGPNDVWAVGTDRTILHYDGAVWEKAAAVDAGTSPYTLRSVWVGAPDDVWIADGPSIVHSEGWKGPLDTVWSSARLTGTAVPSAIHGMGGTVAIARQIGRSEAYLVTCSGWADGGLVGATYLPRAFFIESGTNGLWSIAMSRPNEIWGTNLGNLGRPGSRVVRAHVAQNDGGSGSAPSWQLEEYDSRTERNLYGVWGDEEAIWLAGEGGVIRRLKREDLSRRVFEVIASPVVSALRGIYGFGPDDIWAVGDDATVVHWDGDVWTRLATPFDGAATKPKLFTVWGSGPDDVWIGGGAVLLHFEGNRR